MVAKATQNLFDVGVAGMGFHITSHMVALAALIIACFAIAGYISFRDDSVPGTALKDQDANFEDVVADSLSMGNLVEKVHYEQVTLASGAANGATNDSIHLLNLTLPAGAIITRGTISMQSAGTGTDLGSLNLEVGTLAECTVAGTPAQDISGLIDYNGTTANSRTISTGNLNLVATATDLNRFCLAASANATATGGEVIDCYVTVLYPQGVTPV